MRFSILIPVYNGEKFLTESIDSLLAQSYSDWEAVLVDDGSTDQSGALCDRLAAEHPEHIRVLHQENQGQLASRCHAIQAARGEYCLFMDADDLLVENALAQLEEALCRLNQPELLIYSFFYESESGERRKAEPLFEDGIVFEGENKTALRQTFFSATGLNNVWTKAVKRSCLETIDFDFSPFFTLRCAEDKLHSMVMADVCDRVAYCALPLYVYRLFEGSVTRRYTVDSIGKMNTVSLYETEKAFVARWGLALPEWQQRLEAGYVKSMLYVLDLYVQHVPKKDRIRVLEYDWASFLPPEVMKKMGSNPYLNATHRALWQWLQEKNWWALRLHFFKKRLKKKLRKVR